MNHHSSRSALHLGVLLALSISTSALSQGAQDGTVACGATLGAGGTYELNEDLQCSLASSQDIAITLLDGARLKMNGHTLSCTVNPPTFGIGTGIKLDGHSATLEDGNIVGCRIAVDVGGGGKHLVTHMDVRGAYVPYSISSNGNRVLANAALGGDEAFAITGHRNLIARNHSLDADGNGFLIVGSKNRLFRNTSHDSVCSGFSVSGPMNRLHQNEAVGVRLPNCAAIEASGGKNVLIANEASESAGHGFHLYLNGSNRLLRNVADFNAGTGILVTSTSTGNTLVRNSAIANGTYDLGDENPDCDDNLWQANEFETRNAECIR
jgi:parallel beta-helix repeat protein